MTQVIDLAVYRMRRYRYDLPRDVALVLAEINPKLEVKKHVNQQNGKNNELAELVKK